MENDQKFAVKIKDVYVRSIKRTGPRKKYYDKGGDTATYHEVKETTPNKEDAEAYTYNLAKTIANRNGGSLVQLCIIAAFLLSGCVSVKPVPGEASARVRVFLRAVPLGEAVQVAKESGAVDCITGVDMVRRSALVGSTYTVTVK